MRVYYLTKNNMAFSNTQLPVLVKILPHQKTHTVFRVTLNSVQFFSKGQAALTT